MILITAQNSQIYYIHLLADPLIRPVVRKHFELLEQHLERHLDDSFDDSFQTLDTRQRPIMTEDPLHRVVGPASTASDATTIFNASVEPRFVELRATRKELSRAFVVFLSNRPECAAAVTSAAASEDDFFDLELDEKQIDSDIERVIFALNMNKWICDAHAVLDPNNDYDREMLTNMASYVDKRRKTFADNPFFHTPNEERRSLCAFMSREKILPPRSKTQSARRS